MTVDGSREQVTIIYYFATEVGFSVKSHVDLYLSKDCILEEVINRYTWHKGCVTCGSLQKVLAIKQY